ncbi:MAG: dihydrolipoyl dehydrogenase family protein [Pararhizobium sp.]
MSERLTPDICVIGAGSAGLTVAAAAAAFRVPVVLVERGRMGGDCLNVGCVPSKALIAAARHADAIARAPLFGIDVGEAEVDFARVHAHVRSVVDSIAPNDSEERFRALGVKVVRADAAFTDARTVRAGDVEIRARRFVIATGSRPAVPDIPGLSDVPYLTNETLFDETRLPDRLIVIGGGPIGLEMAQAYRRLGAEVTVIEAARALSREDPELASVVVRRLQAEGVTLLEETAVERVEKSEEGRVRVYWRKGAEAGAAEGQSLLVATGRAAGIDGLGLDAAGIRHDHRGILVRANLKTSNQRVYAIGDVVSGSPQFTHVAGYQAGLVVQQILFRAPAREKRAILPRVTFTDPELAHVGLDEAAARKRHRAIRVLRWPFSENDRAQAERTTEGLIKVVTDRKGRILGTAIAGAGAGEMIGLWALAVARSLTVADIRAYVAPYPTLGEIGKRAALAYYNPLTRKPIIRRTVRFLRRFG